MDDSFEPGIKVVAQRGTLRLISLGCGPYVVQELIDNKWEDLSRCYIHSTLCEWIIDDEKLIKELSTTLLKEGETNI